jgi:hypothetical protein
MTPSNEIAYLKAQVVARILIEARDRMERHASEIRTVQRQRGVSIDTRADYAEGSAAAYAYAGSALAGAFGFGSIEQLAGEWQRPAEAAPPILPDPDATIFRPGDDIAAATVIANRQGDHFAYPDLIDERDGGRNDR